MLFSSSVGKIVFHMRSLLRRALYVYIGVKCLPYKTLNIKHKLAIFMLNMALTKSSLFWTAVLPVLRNVVHVWNKFHVGIASHQQYIWCFSVNLHSNITGNRAVYILSRHQHSTLICTSLCQQIYLLASGHIFKSCHQNSMHKLATNFRLESSNLTNEVWENILIHTVRLFIWGKLTWSLTFSMLNRELLIILDILRCHSYCLSQKVKRRATTGLH